MILETCSALATRNTSPAPPGVSTSHFRRFRSGFSDLMCIFLRNSPRRPSLRLSIFCKPRKPSDETESRSGCKRRETPVLLWISGAVGRCRRHLRGGVQVLGQDHLSKDVREHPRLEGPRVLDRVQSIQAPLWNGQRSSFEHDEVSGETIPSPFQWLSQIHPWFGVISA